MPDLTANNLVAVKPYVNISRNARYHCNDTHNTKTEIHWRNHLDVKCLTGNTYEMPDPVPTCISEVVCTDAPGKCGNYFLTSENYLLIPKKLIIRRKQDLYQ